MWSYEGNVPKVISRFRLRSDDGILLSHPNFKTLTTLGDRAFVAAAPKLLNDLLLEIIEWPNLLTLLKNFYKRIFLVKLFILS